MTQTVVTKTAAEMVAEAKAEIDDISPRDAYDELKAGTAVALDVREPVEWEHHVEGCVQVPRGLLEFAADSSSPRHKPELDPAGRVIVYCRSGVRAVLAAQTLKTLGFGDVVNLDGGFSAWEKEGLPVEAHHEDL